MDGLTHVTLVAEVEGRGGAGRTPVGIARFIRVAEATAEFSVAVADS